MALMGFPLESNLIKMVRNGMVANCPVTVADICAAKDIYGPDVPLLKGKTVCQRSPGVSLDFVEVPDEIYEQNTK